MSTTPINTYLNRTFRIVDKFGIEGQDWFVVFQNGNIEGTYRIIEFSTKKGFVTVEGCTANARDDMIFFSQKNEDRPYTMMIHCQDNQLWVAGMGAAMNFDMVEVKKQ